MASRKILLVIADSSQTGAPVQVSCLAKALGSEFEIACLCPTGWLTHELANEGVKTFELPKTGRTAQAKSLASTMASFQPDIVHAHGVRAGLVAGRIFRKHQSCRLIYTEHLWTADYSLKNPLRQFAQLYLLRQMAKRAEKVVAVSHAVADFLVSKKIVPSAKCQVIYNAIDPVESITPNSQPVIGTLGSLNALKGNGLLLRACQLLIKTWPDLKIRLAGDGPERTSLETLAGRLGLGNRVEFLGADSSDHRQFFASLKVFVQPSYSESFGLAPLEAMAAGLPVVVSGAGALPELITDGPP
ncbi:MAG TPA: glycosyltransferase, partial [Candidatus Saccharimonadales bacterium]|nr:glycosyltransferase [Candidatus Saccharimonadales bacterium]